MDKMQSFCTHIRAALACYEDMPPECQTRARFYVSARRKASGACWMPPTAPAGSLLGSCCRICSGWTIASENLTIFRKNRIYFVISIEYYNRKMYNAFVVGN